MNKTLWALARYLPEDSEPSVENLTRTYRQTLRLRSQLLSVIYDLEAYSSPQQGQQELAEAVSSGRQEDGCAVLTFEESLPLPALGYLQPGGNLIINNLKGFSSGMMIWCTWPSLRSERDGTGRTVVRISRSLTP